MAITFLFHRLEFLSFLALDNLEGSLLVLVFLLEVASFEYCFGTEPVLVFLKTFQFPFSSAVVCALFVCILWLLYSLKWLSFLTLLFVLESFSFVFVLRVLPDVMLDVGDSLLLDDSLELIPDDENGAMLTPLEHPLEPVDVGDDDPPR